MMNTPTPNNMRLRAVDLEKLEQDLAEEAKKLPAAAPLPTVPAASVNEQFKLAAAAVVSMGDEIHERIKRLENGLADCHDVLRIIQEASDSIRQKGQHAQLVIDEAAVTCNEIRNAVSELLQKLNR